MVIGVLSYLANAQEQASMVGDSVEIINYFDRNSHSAFWFKMIEDARDEVDISDVSFFQDDFKAGHYKDFMKAYLKKHSIGEMSVLEKSPGGDAGNGGGAYVCRDNESEIVHAEIVDLWEGMVLNHPQLIINKTNKISPKMQTMLALKRMHNIFPLFATFVSSALMDIFNKSDEKIDKGETNTVLMVISDSLDIERPKYCPGSKRRPQYEQVINYLNSGEMKLDVEIYKALETNTDRAALLLHEAIYYVLRRSQGDSDSRNARKLVASVFADQDESKIEELMKETIGGSFSKEALHQLQQKIIGRSIQTCEYDTIKWILKKPIIYYNNQKLVLSNVDYVKKYYEHFGESIFFRDFLPTPKFEEKKCFENIVPIMELLSNDLSELHRNTMFISYLYFAIDSRNVEAVRYLASNITRAIDGNGVVMKAITGRPEMIADIVTASHIKIDDNNWFEIFRWLNMEVNRNNIDIVKLFLENRIVEIENRCNKSSCYYARILFGSVTLRGDLDLISTMLKSTFFDINLCMSIGSEWQVDNMLRPSASPLVMAALTERMDIFEMMLKSGKFYFDVLDRESIVSNLVYRALLNLKEESVVTITKLLYKYYSEQMIDKLITNGIYSLAKKKKYERLLRLLRFKSKSALLNQVHEVIKTKNIGSFLNIISAEDFNPFFKVEGDKTILHAIAEVDDEDVALKMIQLVFEIHPRMIDKRGSFWEWKTPRSIAAKQGHYRLARLLFWGPDSYFTADLML